MSGLGLIFAALSGAAGSLGKSMEEERKAQEAAAEREQERKFQLDLLNRRFANSLALESLRTKREFGIESIRDKRARELERMREDNLRALEDMRTKRAFGLEDSRFKHNKVLKDAELSLQRDRLGLDAVRTQGLLKLYEAQANQANSIAEKTLTDNVTKTTVARLELACSMGDADACAMLGKHQGTSQVRIENKSALEMRKQMAECATKYADMPDMMQRCQAGVAKAFGGLLSGVSATDTVDPVSRVNEVLDALRKGAPLSSVK